MIALLIIAAVCLVSGQEGLDAATLASINAMKTKELRAELKKRNVACEGCSERQHLRDRVMEVWQMPEVPEEVPEEVPDGANGWKDTVRPKESAPPPPKEPTMDDEQMLDAFEKKYNEDQDMKDRLMAAGINMGPNANIGGMMGGMGMGGMGGLPPHITKKLEARRKAKKKKEREAAKEAKQANAKKRKAKEEEL